MNGCVDFLCCATRTMYLCVPCATVLLVAGGGGGKRKNKILVSPVK